MTASKLVRVRQERVCVADFCDLVDSGKMDLTFRTENEQWDFISLLIMRVPLPTIYIDASDYAYLKMIKGHAQALSIYRFARHNWFAVQSEYLESLNGLTMSKLPRNKQRAIEETYLSVCYIEEGVEIVRELLAFDL